MLADRQRGLSLLEFTLVVVIFSTLGAVFLSRLVSIQVEVERTAVRQTLNQMRTALAVRFAELHIAGDDETIAAWEGGNALSLIREGIDRRGAVGGEDAAPTGPGEWAYQDGTIVYRPAYPEALTGKAAAVGRWRVVVKGAPEEPRGLKLRSIDPLLGDDSASKQGADR